MENFIAGELNDYIRILISAAIMYAGTILLIRLSGKRSTSQMNNFDWVVTVAMGSITGSGIILDNVEVGEALLAVASLLGFQWLLTAGILRHEWLASLVKAEPTLLVDDGRFLDHAMRRERITRQEVLSSVRHKGYASLEDVRCVILEPDADFSVIPRETST